MGIRGKHGNFKISKVKMFCDKDKIYFSLVLV